MFAFLQICDLKLRSRANKIGSVALCHVLTYRGKVKIMVV